MPALDLKIAYLGGGSRGWARKLMFNLARCADLTGQVALYDIDLAAALPIDAAWAMSNQMLQASRAFLPGWKTD